MSMTGWYFSVSSMTSTPSLDVHLVDDLLRVRLVGGLHRVLKLGARDVAGERHLAAGDRDGHARDAVLLERGLDVRLQLRVFGDGRRRRVDDRLGRQAVRDGLDAVNTLGERLGARLVGVGVDRSEEHTSELQSHSFIQYPVSS